jgi:hypothetical protein
MLTKALGVKCFHELREKIGVIHLSTIKKTKVGGGGERLLIL